MTTGSTIDTASEAPTLVGLLDGLVDQGLHVAGDLTIGLADDDHNLDLVPLGTLR